MSRLVLPVLAALLAAPVLANAPPDTVPPPPQPLEWDADEIDGDWTLFYGGMVQIACPEAKGQLRLTVLPRWNSLAGAGGAAPLNGPIDKVTVTFGDKSFAAALDTAVADKPVYVLPADADSVTAIMLAKNAVVTLASDTAQIREGREDTGGAFDMFATTCAQINGLR